MSGTCIVCLGDLGDGCGAQPALPSPDAKSPKIHNGNVDRVTPGGNTPDPANETTKTSEHIAHLKPCGHNLHNDCLTPWVERANSCPICRARFYTVELSDQVGGHVISTYAVQDRSQVAEFDPSMLLEEVDDTDDSEPCQVCEEDDNEDVLMYCDQCSKLYHTYCVGLQEVPVGHWFCDDCRAQRGINPRHPCPPRGRRNRPRPSHRRTRAQQRRFRSQDQATDASWTRVWQSVWDRINLDLDFPDDEEVAATAIRRHRQRNDTNRQEHEAWLLRQRIAELQGGGDSRFRDTAPSLLNHQHASTARTQVIRTRHHPRTPEHESAEDRLAWEAFDLARQEELDAGSSPRRNRRKRKSPAVSPAEPQTDGSERPSKVSRRSGRGIADEVSDSAGSSRTPRPVPRRLSPRLSPSRGPVISDHHNTGPSFLQSLLKEVEDSSAPNHPRSFFYRQSPINASGPSSEQQSPRPSSPALTPSPSSPSSPRAMSATPPPTYSRPDSPTSSAYQPVFSSPDSPAARSSPEPSGALLNSRTSRLPFGVGPSARRLHSSSPPPSRPRSSESSPTRHALSFHAKSDVQKMVSAALKPYYRKKSISREEYTAINRDVSRRLYDQIEDFEALGVEGKTKWERVAGEEVDRAVNKLKDPSSLGQIRGVEMVQAAS